jgi:hypothetical protein
MVQHIIHLVEIINDESKSITIIPRENLKPLGLFHDKYFEEYNFPTLFFGHSRPTFECSYQKTIQAKLTILTKNLHTI